jgi:hypothetical protein
MFISDNLCSMPYGLRAGSSLEDYKITSDHMACSGIAGDSHVKFKNI